MAIVKLDKITLYGAASRKAKTIERLQELGCVHLVNLAVTGTQAAPDGVSTDAHAVLKYLRLEGSGARSRKGLRCPVKRTQIRRRPRPARYARPAADVAAAGADRGVGVPC